MGGRGYGFSAVRGLYRRRRCILGATGISQHLYHSIRAAHHHYTDVGHTAVPSLRCLTPPTYPTVLRRATPHACCHGEYSPARAVDIRWRTACYLTACLPIAVMIFWTQRCCYAPATPHRANARLLDQFSDGVRALHARCRAHGCDTFPPATRCLPTFLPPYLRPLCHFLALDVTLFPAGAPHAAHSRTCLPVGTHRPAETGGRWHWYHRRLALPATPFTYSCRRGIFT